MLEFWPPGIGPELMIERRLNPHPMWWTWWKNPLGIITCLDEFLSVGYGTTAQPRLLAELLQGAWTHQSPPVGPSRASHAPFRKSPLYCRAHVSSPPVRFSVKGPPSATTLPSSSPVFTHLPVWPSPRQPWPSRASCPRAGVLGRRRCALESAAARICQETRTGISTNVFLRDLDLCTNVVRTRVAPLWWQLDVAKTAHILNSQVKKVRKLPSHTRQNLGSVLSGAAVLDAQVEVQAGLRRGPRVRIVVARSPRPSFCGWWHSSCSWRVRGLLQGSPSGRPEGWWTGFPIHACN